MKNFDKIHQKALSDFDKIISYSRAEREMALEDRRFYTISGAQWEGSLGEQFANKPKFEVNKIHLSVLRIINDYRNNRISVDFVAKDGSETDLSDTCDGLYRSDEQYSCAYEAYDNAFEEAVGGGMGAWRLTTCYEDDEDPENDCQRIKIEPIYEAESTVFFDSDSKKQDKSDAEYCYILHSMSRDKFTELYPQASPITRDICQAEYDWGQHNSDVMWVAEYYVKKISKQKIYKYEYIDGSEITITDQDIEKNPDIVENIKSMGARFINEKALNIKRVHKYIIGGAEILEDCGVIAGRHLPIVVTYGKRWFIDNIERFCGHVRFQKDAQRLKNMNLSRLAEIAALSPVQKPILALEQIAGLEDQWAEDNINNYPFLPINSVTDSNGDIIPMSPISYTQPPQIPPALVGLMQSLDVDMNDLMGNQQAGEEMGANLSGKAIELVQNRIDMLSYIYIDNLKKAMQRSGQIWLSMAREIYVEKYRVMKTVNENNKSEAITLLESAITDEGAHYYKHDLSKANFEVYASVGPSSVTRKESTIRSILAMMQATTDPQDVQVLSSMAMMNMEGEGINDIRDYFRKKLVNMGAAKPTKEEQKAMIEAAQNQKPSPSDRLVAATAVKEEALAIKAQADAENAQIDTLKKAAEIDETVAGTAKAYADIEAKDRDFALSMARQRATPPAQMN